jgi:hypothetical protein
MARLIAAISAEVALSGRRDAVANDKIGVNTGRLGR